MSATIETTEHEELRDKEELPIRLAHYALDTSSGKPETVHVKPEPSNAMFTYLGRVVRMPQSTHGADTSRWDVVLSTDGHKIRRDVWVDRTPWSVEHEGWEPEGVIWPTWPTGPADEPSAPQAALKSIEKYWDKTGNRLRDSAKWMAAVLGAGLATLVGTSPLASIRHHPRMSFLTLGIAGLAFLCITLFLIVQVMRPQATSFADVQRADTRGRWFKPALGKWRATVESHQDLYLPCGVKCLTSLRQSMIIEKITLMALVGAQGRISAGTDESDSKICQILGQAEAARAIRLTELRNAAAQIAAIGDYYKLRSRSTRATYGGIFCFLVGSVAIMAAFIWPPS
jgi:hypothetical protein